MTDSTGAGEQAWWRGNSAYQWLVFAVAGGAWLFDNLDQRLFSLARIPAISSLLALPSSDLAVQGMAKTVTAVFLIGWGLGGLTIGALGDRHGRVRMLVYSILIYSLGTGATALAQSTSQFLALRVLAGFGIGGIFGLSVAIITDTFVGARRVAMLAGLQLLSVLGNIGAALTKMGIDGLAKRGVLAQDQVWRWLFGVGTAPIILAAIALIFMREPESWERLKAQNQLPKGALGAYGQLFGQRHDRRNLVVGAMLALSGVVGLWGIGEYATDLQEAVFTAHYRATTPVAEARQLAAEARNLAYLLQMVGAATGMALFTWAANRFGRRPAFIAGFTAAGLVTALVYARMNSPADAYWMIPLMGLTQFSVFAGYSIYLPELFGPRIRGTGVSFCYNLGRFAAAGGGFFSALLSTRVFGHFPSPLPLRYSAMVMCSVFLLGVIAAWMGPETRGKELED